jgi:2-polyprenyl-3-methyl-5-hydroxy-6-metoxy-1,4-benzoquinol methylase
MTSLTDDKELQKKILDENRRVHALENKLYLSRHPEQTNFFQRSILNKALDSFCKILPANKKRIVDIGCGSGYVFLPMVTKGYQMTGVDLSEEMIQALKENLDKEKLSRSELIVGDVVEFSNGNTAPFDGMIVSALLHHLYDFKSAVRKFCSKVAPEGPLLIFFEPLRQKINSPIRYGLHKRLAEIEERIYKKEMKFRKIPIFEDDYEYSDYQRQFGGIDPKELAEILEQQGMEIIKTSKYCARRYGIPAFIANSILGTANTFNILAKKRS